MHYLTLTLRSGHRLYLKPTALIGFYPDVSEGTSLITTAPHNLVVEEEPEDIMRMLEPKEKISDADADLLR